MENIKRVEKLNLIREKFPFINDLFNNGNSIQFSCYKMIGEIDIMGHDYIICKYFSLNNFVMEKHFIEKILDKSFDMIEIGMIKSDIINHFKEQLNMLFPFRLENGNKYIKIEKIVYNIFPCEEEKIMLSRATRFNKVNGNPYEYHNIEIDLSYNSENYIKFIDNVTNEEKKISHGVYRYLKTSLVKNLINTFNNNQELL